MIFTRLQAEDVSDIAAIADASPPGKVSIQAVIVVPLMVKLVMDTMDTVTE